jgi:hypothetical protein
VQFSRAGLSRPWIAERLLAERAALCWLHMILEWVRAELLQSLEAGHFGYFRLLLDMVDGKIRPSAEDETTGDADCVLVLADDSREAGTARAAA